jgi:Na+-driven multidrug efflux pump
LQGAAIATTLAQWVSTAVLIPAARQKLVADHDLGLWKKKKQKNQPNQNTPDTVTGSSFLGFAAPVLTLILGKLAAFGFMTHTAAAVPGQPTPLASHQIILSLLFFCSPFLEVISQTAQTFLPPFTAPVIDYIRKQKAQNPQYDSKTDSIIQPWEKAAQNVATRLLGMGFVSAGVIASLASLIPARFGHWITTDTVIQKAIQPMAKYLWLGAFFWAPVAVSEGVLLARLELKFLASIYLLSTALLPPALLRVKHQGGTVGQVWSCFVIFQLFRAITFTGRIWGGFALQHLFGGTTKQSLASPKSKKAA